MSKKSNKREKQKFPGINKNVNLKIRNELIDFDYINKLNDEEKLLVI